MPVSNFTALPEYLKRCPGTQQAETPQYPAATSAEWHCLRSWTRLAIAISCLLILLPGMAGCVSQKCYQYGCGKTSLMPYPKGTAQSVADHEPHPHLDRWEGCLYHWADKARLDRGEDLAVQRNVAQQSALDFLSENLMQDVHVAVRSYQPSEQWSRLRNNEDIHPLLKYTDGSARVLMSTILPERMLRIDRYNPYTKTLSLNSHRPSKAIYAAANAKVHLAAAFPGCYAVAQRLPFVPIWHHYQVTSDSLTYARQNSDWELERELYRTGYAKIGGSVVSDVDGLLPAANVAPIFIGPTASLAGRLLGTATGELRARQVEKSLEMARIADEAAKQ